MHGADLIVRGLRVVTPAGVHEASIHVADGRIERVAAYDDAQPGREVVDAGDLVVLPGLVDTHVHVNEPGRTEWEGFASATRAAAAGGVTTILDMPLNSIPPTVTPEALAEKRAAAEGNCAVDVGFWGGAIVANLGRLHELHAAGVFGFKCFLCPSGVEEFPPLDLDQLRAAMTEIAAFDGLLIAHAELPGPIEDATARTAGADPHAYATYLASRPPEAEESAVEAVVDAAMATGCRAHVLHLSAAGALRSIDRARDAGVPITAETCPHYLTFASEEIEANAPGATEFKCAPPIRDAENREQLWAGVKRGLLPAVVSDHSPCTPELKAGSYFDAWGGIASLQLGLRVVWTAARGRAFSLEDVARWMSEGPAAIAGLASKGAIAEGKDADLVLFDPHETSVCDPGELQHRHKITPYAGRRLDGRVEATYVRGMKAYDAGGGFPDPPTGMLLTRGSA